MFFTKSYFQTFEEGTVKKVMPMDGCMGSDEKVMGIPQLLHFQTLVTTGALFLGIVAVRLL